MTRSLIITAVLAAFASVTPSLAQAPVSPMAGAFGNTIVTTYADGTSARTFVDPDGTYRSLTGSNESRGTWSVKKGLICYTQTVPAPAPDLCAIGAKKKLGAKWRVFLANDQSIKVEIVAGR